ILTNRVEEKKFIFNDNNLVVNATHYNIDTLTRVILSNIYKMDSVNILIAYMPIVLESYELERNMFLIGYLVPNPYKEKSYFIFLSRFINSNNDLLFIMSHEMVHANQYYSGDLIMLTQEIYIYKGDTINALNIPYTERQYERDAYREENQVIKKLHDLLYEKKSS
ncbi:MAG: hypothetical protein ACXAAH_16785, partial [Promethearchaeota archaeon]